MSGPRLSVILPVYNHAQFIARALSAILEQSYRAAEVIIVDDGSVDGSGDIAMTFAWRHPNVRVIRYDRNRGVLAASARALEVVTGDYIYGAGADDFVLPSFFEKTMALLTKFPEAGLCCSDAAVLDADTGVVREHRLGLSTGAGYLPPDSVAAFMRRRDIHIWGHTVTVKRSAFERAGRWMPELKWDTDMFAHWVIAFRHGLCYVPEPLACYRRAHDSYSGSSRYQVPAQRAVLLHMTKVLASPLYSDVRGRFVRSAVLSRFGILMVSLALSEPNFREFLTQRAARRALWWEARRQVSARTPVGMKRLYARMRAPSRRVPALPRLPLTTESGSSGT